MNYVGTRNIHQLFWWSDHMWSIYTLNSKIYKYIYRERERDIYTLNKNNRIIKTKWKPKNNNIVITYTHTFTHSEQNRSELKQNTHKKTTNNWFEWKAEFLEFVSLPAPNVSSNRNLIVYWTIFSPLFHTSRQTFWFCCYKVRARLLLVCHFISLSFMHSCSFSLSSYGRVRCLGILGHTFSVFSRRVRSV